MKKMVSLLFVFLLFLSCNVEDSKNIDIGKKRSALTIDNFSLKLPFQGGEQWYMTCGYGCGYHTDGNNLYYSLDFDKVGLSENQEPGEPVVAPADGIVTFAGLNGGFGYSVKIDTGEGYIVMVSHLRYSPIVSAGDYVYQGEQLGIMGGTGTGGEKIFNDHIHFTMYYNGECKSTVSQSKPEPMSGYTNFTTGYYISDNYSHEFLAGPDTVALYHMNETSGSTVYDSTANGNNGTSYGTTIDYGRFSKTRKFINSTDKVQVPAAASINNLSAFTYEMWVNRHMTATRYLIYKGTNKQIYFNGSNRIEVVVGYSGTSAHAISMESISDTYDWYYIAVTFDDSGDKKPHIYINGREVSYDTQTAGSGSMLSDSGSNLLIGSDGDYGGFYGHIDEARISDIARSGSSIRDYYNAVRAGAPKMDNDVKLSLAMEGAGMCNLYDTTGRHAVNNNGAYYSGGVEGFGRYFDGENDFIYIDDHDDFAPNHDMTIDFWIKSDGGIEDGDWIVSKYSGTGTTGWNMFVDGTTVRFRWYGTNSWNNINVCSLSEINDNRWHYIAVTLEKDTWIAKSYVDAELQNTVDGNYLAADSQKIYIGQTAWEAGRAEMSIDEFRYSTTARSGDEIEENYVRYKDRKDLTAFWRFDEGDGVSEFNDETPFNDVAKNYGLTYDIAGKFGRARDFVPASGSTLQVLDSTVWQEDGAFSMNYSSLSIEAWIYIDNVPNDETYVMYKYKDGYDMGWYMRVLNNTSPYLELTVDNPGTSTILGSSGESPISKSAWHHVAFTIDEDSGAVKLYIDGDLKDSATMSGGYTPVPGQEFYLGSRKADNYYFDGKIDHVTVYNYARTADQIEWDANQ